jgi:restriction system protein
MGKRKSGGEVFLELVAKLPWWVCIVLAILSYVILHAIASSPLPPIQSGAKNIPVFGLMLRGVSSAGQYILPILFTVGALVSFVHQRRGQELLVSAEDASAIADMSWQDFELFISEVFKRQGFRVLHTGSDGPDGGVDLVLLKGTEKHLVQCKHWRASKVGVTTVRELYGVMTAQRATGGYVVTSGQFTEDAREFAAGRHLFLVDGPILKRWIRDIPKKTTRSEPRHPLQSATSTGPKSENCPQCGAEMVLRTAKQGANAGQRFWGCSTFPKCKGTKPLLGS